MQLNMVHILLEYHFSVVNLCYVLLITNALSLMKHIRIAFVHCAGEEGKIMVILDLREDESLKREGVAREVNRCNRSRYIVL